MTITQALRPVRQVWRSLTSMRTALILLFLLAVAAVPGSILPQRPLNSDKTDDYISKHGGWGRFLNSIGMFDVFGSVWFSAVYLLLFVSLIGCLVPRIRLHVRAVARKPLAAPRNLGRLPESATFQLAGTPEQVAPDVRRVFGRRWRTVVRGTEISAEKGYLRETGNIVFHVALLAALVLIAVGRLFNYEGQVIVAEGHGFSNLVPQYDTWKPGRLAAAGDVTPAPFVVENLDKFTATYTADGQATDFAADITYKDNVDAPLKKGRITVNHPLRLEGDRLYLVSHGYSAQITVTMPDGRVRHETANLLTSNPQTYFSEGAYSLQGPTDAKQDVGISAFFAPTGFDDGSGVITSLSPQVNNPILGIRVFDGDLGITGAPRSVYSIDTTKMTQLGMANLKPGESKTFGKVTVRFDGWSNWAGFQVSHDPAQSWLLVAAVAMVVGLFASLAVRRRRVWVRLVSSSADPSLTVVSVGGLARSDSGNFTAEFEALVERLRASGKEQSERDQRLSSTPV